MAMNLPKKAPGEKRRFDKCLDCGKPQFSDFVPFGIGYGRRYNQCQCQMTSNNTHRLKTITRREYEHLDRVWKKRHPVLIVHHAPGNIEAVIAKALKNKKSIHRNLVASLARRTR